MTPLNGFLKVGNGPRKVLAMNGWFGSSADWAPILPALDLDAFTYVFFDYRGYGRSIERNGDHTFAEAAADVIALADHLNWQRFSLLGHSMGGMAMQKVLLAAPGRIERMVGIAAVPACGSRMDAARLAAFERAVNDVAARAAIIDFSTGKRLSPAWSARLAQESAQLSRPEAFAGYLPQWAASDMSADVVGHPVPVKVFIGEHDPTLTPELMRSTWLAWYRNAEMEVLPNAAHYPMHEVPVALATALENYLKRAQDRTAHQ
jgi:esterase